MSYFSGTAPSSSTPAKDFMEQYLHANMQSSGFTYVEEVIASGTARIYKSPAASNGVGDWYAIYHRATDAATSIAVGACEDYDSSAHLAKKWIPYSLSGGLTLPADRSHPTTAGTAPNAATLSWIANINLSLNAFSYILSLNVTRIVVSTKVVSSENMYYLGLYESMLPGVANHFPLVASGVSTGSTYCNTTYSREPGTGVTVQLGASGNGNGSFGNTQSLGTSGLNTVGNPVAMDGFMFKPTLVRTYTTTSQNKASTGRGLFIGLYTGTASFAWGDIINMDLAGTPMTGTCVFSSQGRVIDQAF